MASRGDRHSYRDRVLTALRSGPLSNAQIVGRIGYFWRSVLYDLKRDGLVTRIQGEYFLTPQGQQARKALDA